MTTTGQTPQAYAELQCANPNGHPCIFYMSDTTVTTFNARYRNDFLRTIVKTGDATFRRIPGKNIAVGNSSLVSNRNHVHARYLGFHRNTTDRHFLHASWLCPLPFLALEPDWLLILISNVPCPATVHVHSTTRSPRHGFDVTVNKDTGTTLQVFNGDTGYLDYLNISHTFSLTPPVFNGNSGYVSYLDISHIIHLPKGEVIMVSFPLFDLQDSSDFVCLDHLTLYSAPEKGVLKQLWTKCGVQAVQAAVYNTSLSIRFVTDYTESESGFRMLFSYHKSRTAPVKLGSGLFDCSHNYASFRQHLHCNLRHECQAGEDEPSSCPYHPPPSHHSMQRHCRGAVHFQDKCFSYHAFEKERGYKTWNGARLECQRRGGDLAMPQTPQQLAKLHSMVNIGLKGRCAYVGLQSVFISSTPRDNLYWKGLRWLDGTTGYVNISIHDRYFRHVETVKRNMYQTLCFVIRLNEPGTYFATKCVDSTCNSYLCEGKVGVHASVSSSGISLFLPIAATATASNNIGQSDLHLVKCPAGHMTHDFLSCDHSSHCGVREGVKHCEVHLTEAGRRLQRGREREIAGVQHVISVETFECHTKGGTIPYTLLCDFRPDCADASDETFCYKQLQNFTGFRCSNGQTVGKDTECNFVGDCFDNSDETECAEFESKRIFNLHKLHRKAPPVIIHMNGQGDFTETRLDPVDPVCPETHFRCPGQHVYCMPVYLRCNGVKDCSGGEDEINCHDVTCPGYYRCRSSSVWLHGNHLCDGWPQCPERDDELLCNITCPSACHCQGLAFVCHRPFPASHYPDLRYLDATGSGIVPEDVVDNVYLVYLKLAGCGLTTWPEVVLLSLQRLDLNDNHLTEFHLQHLQSLPQLRMLCLKGNPVSSIISSSTGMKHHSLVTLDLSYTHIATIDSGSIIQAVNIRHLNFSFSRLKSIGKRGFSNLANLATIDLRGCDIGDFPSDSFRQLLNLDTVYAENYQFCCRANLPATFNTEQCFYHQDYLSSCKDLLRSSSHRVCLWSLAVVSIVGNVCTLVVRFQPDKLLKWSHRVFLTHLKLSNFLMGASLLFIGIVDTVHHGQYIWYGKSIERYVTCHVIGFMYWFSHQGSVFIILLITLDRFLALRLPSKAWRLNGKSAILASAVTWAVTTLLATLPLAFYSQFYTKSSICSPFTSITSNPEANVFAVAAVAAHVMFVFLTAMGQSFLYWMVRSHTAVLSDTSSFRQHLTVARRLMTLVVSDCLCWLAVCVVAVAALVGMSVPGEVNAVIDVVALPLNAAFNPLLYAYSLQAEKRQRVREDRIVTMLRSALRNKS